MCRPLGVALALPVLFEYDVTPQALAEPVAPFCHADFSTIKNSAWVAGNPRSESS